MINLGGTYRTVPPELTLAKVQPLLWSKFAISRVANITGLDNLGIPTYLAIRPAAKLLTTAQGKGLTKQLAKVSAIMESIEGWHAESMNEPDLFGSYTFLNKKYPLVNLNPLMNHGPFEWQQIETLEIPWARAVELNTGKEIYTPYTTLSVNTAYRHQGVRYFPPTTNGLAAGNSLDEAICHGLLEVLEREFFSTPESIFNSPCLDLSTIKNRHILGILNSIKQRKLSLLILDISTEMKIPAFLALMHDMNGIRVIGRHMGTGAHFSSEVALIRALTEVIQSRLTAISGTRDDFLPRAYKKTTHVCSEGLEQFFKSRQKKMVPFYETKTPDSFRHGIQYLIELLKEHGFQQVLVYNHTKENLMIPVVHVVVPGLRYSGGTCFSCNVSQI